MAPLDSNLFNSGGDICETDINNCELGNTGLAVNEVLVDYGWGGKPAGCIVLHLSPDNERIAAGSLVLRGTEDTEYRLPASKFWADADMNVTVTIRLPVFDNFLFTDGGLTSDYLPDEEIVHYFHLQQEGGPPKPILTNNLGQFGIGRFCLRLVCQVAKTSCVKNGVRLKFIVMLYPSSLATLRQMSALVSKAEWPGLKIGEGELPMLPAPSKPWRCPILPLLRPAVSFDVMPTAPNSGTLRTAIAGIMAKSGVPESARSPASLAAKWEKLLRTPGDLGTKAPPTTWPPAEPLAATTGK